MSTYTDLGFDTFGIRVIPSYKKQTPQETRASAQPGAVSADRLYVGSGDNVVKADKDGLYVGNKNVASAPFRVDMEGNATFSSAEINVRPRPGTHSALRITKADGTQVMDVDTTNGWVNIGPDQPLYEQDPQVSLYIVKSTDGYHAVNIMNPNPGTLASCDIGVINNNPDSSGGFFDMGIASMAFSDPNYALYGPGECYLWSADNNVYIGTAGVDKNLYFFSGGTDSKDYITVWINSQGVIFPKQAETVSAPDYVKGGVYYDTTLHKLRVGGVAAWETITSVA